MKDDSRYFKSVWHPRIAPNNQDFYGPRLRLRQVEPFPFIGKDLIAMLGFFHLLSLFFFAGHLIYPGGEGLVPEGGEGVHRPVSLVVSVCCLDEAAENQVDRWPHALTHTRKLIRMREECRHG